MRDAVNFSYLESYTASDRQVIVEVLALFQGQAEVWRASLEQPSEGWRDLIHAIKGSARSIGAEALGDVCDVAEFADASHAPAVSAALAEALKAIETYLTARTG